MSNSAVRVRVNGEVRQVLSGSSVLDLLHALNLDPARVAVEVDCRIVKAADWPQTILRDGAQVEIVQFVGGG